MSVQRIILATNLAPHADRAMERAVQLAQYHSAQLAVVFIRGKLKVDAEPGRFDLMTHEDISALISRHLSKVPGINTIKYDVLVADGEFAETMKLIAAKVNPDLVVVGGHRTDVLSDLFSTTSIEELSLAVESSILVVNEKAFGPYEHVMVPVDFTAKSQSAIKAALTVSRDAELRLLHVDSVMDLLTKGGSENNDEEKFRELLEGLDVSQHRLSFDSRQGFPMNTIVHTAITEKVDIVVMATAGRQGIERALMGSTAHEVLARIPGDMILVREVGNS